MKFAQCAVGSRSRVWFAAEEGDDFRLLQLKEGKWAARTPDWPISCLCGIDRGSGNYEVLALGNDGELLIGSPGSFSESHLDPVQKGPDRYGVMRDIRWIGEDVFAVGMSRQAYRRTGKTWQDISGSMRKAGLGEAGLNSVHGLSPNAVFAVGFGGEVWFYDGTNWRPVDSPTSVALHRVVVLPSGHAIACGAGGVVLQGSPETLVPVQNEVTRDNLYGLAHFHGRVYVSSLTAMFAIGKNGLEAVDLGLTGALTFGSLDASSDVIWSAGARHLFASDDGASWEQVMCPV